jgi:hypothetical protein
MSACCNHNCNQGDDCPLRHPHDLGLRGRVGWLLVALIWSMVAVAILTGCEARDSTDPPNGFSGMTILKDALTGCEYLAGTTYSGTGTGGITPRVAADGKTHMGCGPKRY